MTLDLVFMKMLLGERAMYSSVKDMHLSATISC